MITGVEIDFVVVDALAALALYEQLFDVSRIEVTALPKGQNEAVFSVYGTRFHLLDENAAFGLSAPTVTQSVWFNVSVPDIAVAYEAAMRCGCTQIMAITQMKEMGVSNAMFADPFGYTWMLHQVHKIVPFKQRVEFMTKEKKSDE